MTTRILVCEHRTTDRDVDQTLEAVARVLKDVD